MMNPGGGPHDHSTPEENPHSDSRVQLRLMHPNLRRDGAYGAAEVADDARYAAVGCCDDRSPCAAEALCLALEAARQALGATIQHDAVGRRIHALSESLRQRRNDLPRTRGRRTSEFRASLLAVRVLSGDTHAWCLACGDVTIHIFDGDGNPAPVDGRLSERVRTPLPEGYPHSAWCRLALPSNGQVLLASGPLERRFSSAVDLLGRLENGEAVLTPDDACVWLSVGALGG